MSQSVQTRSAGGVERSDVCPECGGDVEPGRESVCRECGLVVDEDQLDRGPDWQTFEDSNEEEKRAGPALTEARHDRGLATKMWGDRDSNGNKLSNRKRKRLERMRTWNTRARMDSHGGQRLAEAFGEIARMTTALGMSDRREEICRLYRTAHTENLILGRSMEAMASAAVHAVSRLHGCPTMLHDVAEVSRVDQAEIKQGYDVLNRELGLPSPPPKPTEYVGRFASELDCPDDVRRLAERLAARFPDVYPSASVAPNGVAGGAIYIASNSRGRGLNQSEVADVADVTPVTLRHRSHDFADVLEEVLDDGE